MNVTTKTSEYYGKPCLEFRNGSGKPFSLGPYKLRMILTALPEVRVWLIEQGETVPVSPTEPTTEATDDGSLTKRVEALEGALAIILEEITKVATPMDNDANHRQLQLD